MESNSRPTAAGDAPALHPCYSPAAHRHFARLHLAVAPKCNIQCNYCNRKYHCSNESRPGVVAELLEPDQAIRKALAVGAAIPHLAVIGVAGPGDPLANPEPVFTTLRELREQAPDLLLCLSTNGLALPEHADTLAEHGIHHVTITINCVDPDIGAQIYPWIVWRGRRLRGREAAATLIEQQLRGLDLLVARGVQVKINSVLIPGINDTHIPEVNRIVREKGAILHNIMPLIARPEHGTHFGLTGQRADHRRTGGNPRRLQERRRHDESLPTMSRRRHRPVGHGSQRRIHHGQGRGDDGGPASGHGQTGCGARGHRPPAGTTAATVGSTDPIDGSHPDTPPDSRRNAAYRGG